MTILQGGCPIPMRAPWSGMEHPHGTSVLRRLSTFTAVSGNFLILLVNFSHKDKVSGHLALKTANSELYTFRLCWLP